MNELTLNQKNALESKSGVFVLAGAGSGKTFVISEYVKKILKKPRKGWIIVLTFSKKAAQELEERIVFRDKFLFIGTIHSFYHEFLPDKQEILSELEEKTFHEFFIQNYLSKNAHLLTRKYYYEELFRSFLKNRFNYYSDESSHKETENLLRDFEKFFQKERSMNKISFNELEEKAYQHLWNLPVEKLVVDEFQDTSLKQLEIFLKLVKDPDKFFFVGDFKQSIYGFRGGGVKDHPLFQSLKKISLEENFRSYEKIVHYANEIFAEEKQKIVHEEKGIIVHGANLEDFLKLEGSKAILFRTFKGIQLLKKQLKNFSYQEQKRYYLKQDPYILLYEEILLFDQNRDQDLFFKRLSYYEDHFQLKFNLEGSFEKMSLEELYLNFMNQVSILTPLAEDLPKLLSYVNLHNIEFIKDSYQTFHEGSGDLSLMTIHGSKGLEFDYVFLSDILNPQRKSPLDYYLGKGAYRYYENNIFKKTPTYEQEEKKRKENIEDQRLFYVAVTRAKKGLFLAPS